MKIADLITIQEFCTHYQIPESFINSLYEYDLIEIVNYHEIQHIEKNVKHETQIDANYYHIEPVLKKHDMTVDHVQLAPYTMTEYREVFVPVLKKHFAPHPVYEALVEYHNKTGEKYDLKRVDYDEFVKQYAGKKRGSAELAITSLYHNLIAKKIPIRISQLLQHTTDLKYLKNYVYFLMGIESGKYTSNAVMYAIFHAKHHPKFRSTHGQ